MMTCVQMFWRFCQSSEAGVHARLVSLICLTTYVLNFTYNMSE